MDNIMKIKINNRYKVIFTSSSLTDHYINISLFMTLIIDYIYYIKCQESKSVLKIEEQLLMKK